MKTLKALFGALIKRKSVFSSMIILVFLTFLSVIRRDSVLFVASFVCTALYIAIVFAFMLHEYRKMSIGTDSPMLSTLMFEFIADSTIPVVVINIKGEIAWYNRAFVQVSGIKGTLYGKNISEKINHALVPARLFREDALPVLVPLSGASYEVTGFPVTASGQSYCVTLWENKSDLIRMKNELTDKNVLVAFLVIDNFSEAMQFVQDKSRTASAALGSEIDKWCASIGAVVKEYDREKYFILFEQKHLDTLREGKFEILDTIRNVVIDDVVMQFTASIGISSADGTLAEKEASSRAALDLALQRGGDQAVIKTKTSVEYYGGRSKSVQKKTKVRSRVVANELCQVMKDCSNVLVMGHKYADHDSIASCIAVSRLAKFMEKQVNVIVNIHDFNLKAIFNSMRGKPEYFELFVDREQAQELIQSKTLVVVCDVNNTALFEIPEVYEAASSVVIIDHHRKTGEFINPPKITYIEPSASSTSELMSEILEQTVPQGTLPAVEANLLFSGIILDTKQFTKNTGVRTFGAALYLRSEGASPFEAQKLFRTNINDFMRESIFEHNIQIYRQSIAISVYEGQADNRDRIAAAKAADRLLSVEGVSTSFVLFSVDSEVSISARSDGNVNVQLVLEKLGGGGHFDSAGAQIKGITIKDALERLKNAIDAYLDVGQDE